MLFEQIAVAVSRDWTIDQLWCLNRPVNMSGKND